MPLPVSVTVPAAGVRNVSFTEWPLTFAAVIATPQPATPTVVFTSTFLPFWPRIVPVSGRGAPHVSALAASAEFDANAGNASVNEVIGTSGTVANVDWIPLDRLSVPLRSTVI